MRLIRIALCNVNSTVGAVRSNCDRAIALAEGAAKDEATVAAFPEQVLGGYPPEDLVQWQKFLDAQWQSLERFAKTTSALNPVFALGLVVGRGASVYNCAAVVHRGKICGLVPKEKLPNYNVFYEGRTLQRGTAGLRDELHGVPFGDLVFEFDFGTLAVEVCEDIWSPDGPMRRRAYSGAELVLNLSASPFRLGVLQTRREMIATRAGDNQATVAYVNLVGSNDGLIFDGGGLVAQNGRLLHEAPRFVEGVTAVTVDLDRTARLRRENTTWRGDQELFSNVAAGTHRVTIAVPSERAALRFSPPANRNFFLPVNATKVSAQEQFCEEILDALALGVGDYFEKVGTFRTIGVALSGGRDSLLCLWIARRYLDNKFSTLDDGERKKAAQKVLRAFFMPTRFSSAETEKAARAAADELGAPLSIVSIDDAFVRECEAAEKMLQPGETVSTLARQNVQARLRAERMWTWANSASGLFLQTSNMSEKAVGYTTIGGDLEGALAVIANLPKTVVNYLLDYLYEKTHSEAIRLTLIKPPSAELDDNMEDERDLMPFEVLDACFLLYAGEKMAPDEVKLALGEIFPERDRAQLEAWTEKFTRLFTQSIYKWVQAPLSLHVGNLDLERERALQLPVVQTSEWQKE